MSKVQEVLERNNITLQEAKNMCGIVEDLLSAYLKDESKKNNHRINTFVDWKCGAEALINRFINEYKEEKYFLVDIVEHYSKRVKVKAKDFDEACAKVDEACREGKVKMNGDDYADGEITDGKEVTNEDLSMYEEVEE